jgi:hypothetical protein
MRLLLNTNMQVKHNVHLKLDMMNYSKFSAVLEKIRANSFRVASRKYDD